MLRWPDGQIRDVSPVEATHTEVKELSKHDRSIWSPETREPSSTRAPRGLGTCLNSFLLNK